ncbi:hypothetical protein RD792_011638 [Penstemon davidsonii]|uniref:Protein FAR1-RELATED SEQUENCE n=1 Tax=Penstemon davidsonii TaxID=160366 RepID=A0ABR0CUQ5_9LAMI|nr:hypothetical protein RD792_011638 [Penstemon davidsonii]
MLLGCALLADETKPTFVWLMKTWLRAMGGQAPKVILADQDKPLKSAIEEVFANSRHCFALWHILQKIPETLVHVLKQHDNFMKKLYKCIFKRWWKMVGRFELQENEWVHSLYVDRKKWVPTFMRETFLAGMSTSIRSESVNSFFDKYIQKKINLKEFVRQYGTILQNRYEEEDMADFDTWHKQPALKSPSPWEKQMSTIYTHAVFRKFQVEVLGVVGCHPKKEKEKDNVGNIIFRVDDCEKTETFMRWTKDAKNRQVVVEGTERIQTRVQRYNDLCRRAIELGEEGSLSEENYKIASRALVEALKNCVNINNRSTVECSGSSVALRGKRTPLRPTIYDGFYGTQQSMPVLGHLDFRQPSFSYGIQVEHNVRMDLVQIQRKFSRLVKFISTYFE